VVSMNLICCTYFSRKLFLLLHEHRKRISDNFSYSEKIDLKWLWRFNFFAYTLSVFAFGYFVLLLQGLLNEQWLNNIYFSSISIFAVVLCFEGYFQGTILRETGEKPSGPQLKEKKKPVEPDKNRGMEKSSPDVVSEQAENQQSIEQLIGLMQKEKPYLDSKLSCAMVAGMLDMQPYRLSRLINQSFNKNFFEFINDYRIDEFKQRAADPKNRHFSLLGLALDSGFNSKATFNRIFKNSTGQTPSEFRKNFNF